MAFRPLKDPLAVLHAGDHPDGVFCIPGCLLCTGIHAVPVQVGNETGCPLPVLLIVNLCLQVVLIFPEEILGEFLCNIQTVFNAIFLRGGKRGVRSRHHRLAAKVNGAKQGDFLVWRRGRHHGIHKPNGAQSGIVYKRRIIAVQHHIAGVQGIEHRGACGHPGGHILQAFGPVKLLVKAVYFASKIVLNEVLITLQFSRRVAANTLVMIRRNGRIEHVHRKVKHAVLRVFIGLDHLVHRTFGKGLGEVLGGGEMIGIQIALSNYE